jgi:hypothetical protein
MGALPNEIRYGQYLAKASNLRKGLSYLRAPPLDFGDPGEVMGEALQWVYKVLGNWD